MIYKVKLIIDESSEIRLFEIDIPKGQAQNIVDAMGCEMKYNDFDMII